MTLEVPARVYLSAAGALEMFALACFGAGCLQLEPAQEPKGRLVWLLGSVWARAGSDSALFSLAHSRSGYPREIVLIDDG